jgi:hypothetical protein
VRCFFRRTAVCWVSHAAHAASKSSPHRSRQRCFSPRLRRFAGRFGYADCIITGWLSSSQPVLSELAGSRTGFDIGAVAFTVLPGISATIYAGIILSRFPIGSIDASFRSHQFSSFSMLVPRILNDVIDVFYRRFVTFHYRADFSMDCSPV